MNRKLFMITALLAFAFLVAGSLQAKTFALTATKIVPAATGQVDTSTDKNNNIDVTIKTEHLAEPGMLTPPAATYVIWFQQQEGEPQNQGQLKIGKSLKGEFKTTTRLQNFDVFITAESDPLTKTPTGQTVLRTKVDAD